MLSMMLATVTLLPQAPEPNGLSREQMSRKSLTEMVPRHADILQEYPTASTNRFKRSPKHLDDNFMIQVLRVLTRKDAFCDLLLVNRNNFLL